MNMINKEPERYDIEALLPWHAAGTLSRRDADRVEQLGATRWQRHGQAAADQRARDQPDWVAPFGQQ